jgi:large subunit ribosomal protein L21
MYAVVEIGGKQFKVASSDKVKVPKLDVEVGKKVKFDKVLLLADNGTVKVGNPTVEGAKVEAKVLSHGKDEKVIVFKKKRRKGYRVKRGHRQLYTEIEISKILE